MISYCNRGFLAFYAVTIYDLVSSLTEDVFLLQRQLD